MWSCVGSYEGRTWSFDENIKASIDTSYRHLVLARDSISFFFINIWYIVLKTWFIFVYWDETIERRESFVFTKKKKERALFVFTAWLRQVRNLWKARRALYCVCDYACMDPVQPTASFLSVCHIDFKFYWL